MTERVITVYLDDETGEGFYVDCPACHFWKNVAYGAACRNLHCTSTGVTVKVPVTTQPPLTGCNFDIIFHNENTGTDGAPVIEAYVSCNLEPSQGGCGFSVPFHDDEGTKHDAYDWWVTTDDVRRYEALHQAHAAKDS